MIVLFLFALGGGVTYLSVTLAITLALGAELPPLGWIGFAIAATVTLAASTALAVFLVRSTQAAGAGLPRPRPKNSRRLLLVADEACSGAALATSLEGRNADVFVVAPTLVSPIRFLDSDLDPGRASAQGRLAETVTALAERGIDARGVVGSEIPLEAIEDALAFFPADEIVVATPPSERANWLEEGVVERARSLWNLPVSHVVVSGAAERENH
jgi:hypothetical protein